MEIGRYVNMNNGKVKVYNIFLAAGASILPHSVSVVISPRIKNIRYPFNIPITASNISAAIPAQLIMLAIIQMTLAITPASERTKAGVIDISMS